MKKTIFCGHRELWICRGRDWSGSRGSALGRRKTGLMGPMQHVQNGALVVPRCSGTIQRTFQCVWRDTNSREYWLKQLVIDIDLTVAVNTRF